MQRRVASPYLRLAGQSIDMASRATEPTTRKILEHFAEIWLGLAADEFDAAAYEAKRARSRSNYLTDIQHE